MTTTRMSGAEYLARALEAYGVTAVFFVPTILSKTLYELETRTSIDRILTHGEKAAVYMADGYARASGRPGVCMAQTVGAANLAAGLRDPYLRVAGRGFHRRSVQLEPRPELLPGDRGLPAVQARDEVQCAGH